MDLSDQMIDDGSRIVEKLDESAVELTAALWIRFEDLEDWKLALSLPLVAQEGPKAGYKIVQRALKDLGGELKTVSLEDIAILRPDAPLLVLLRGAIRTGADATRVRFEGNVINGELFPDSVIYRVM